MTRVLGAVLAGGRSRRFGSDKALARIGEATLLDLAVAGLAPQVDGLVVCGRAEAGGVTCIPDRPAPDLGPLGGVNAALHHARTLGYAFVVTVPCDLAAVPSDLVDRLRAAGMPAIVETLPVIGLWPAALADVLATHLADTDDRSMRRWSRMVDARSCRIDGLANINTPGDLEALRPASR